MKKPAFTLAELLIALAVLGVIAAFTIPKVLVSQQSASFKAIGKETAAMISDAYTAYKRDNVAGASTKPIDLRPYMNYVRVPPGATLVDAWTGNASISVSCNSCILLHNGATLTFWDESFGGTATTNAIRFVLDPDGKVTDGTTNGPGKALVLHMYYSGRITSWGTLDPNTKDSVYTWNPIPANDPAWFSWN